MKKKLVVFLLSLMAIVCLFAGCSSWKNTYEAGDFTLEAVSAESFQINFPSYRPHDYVTYEYSLDDEHWADEPEDEVLILENLTPGQKYGVYIRIKENDKVYQSEKKHQEITLDKRTVAVPNVTLERNERTVTVIGYTDKMEVCYENDEYVSAGTYNYSEGGVKNVKIRYKETATDHVSDPQTLSITVCGLPAGTGTEADPFIIKEPRHLYEIQDAVNTLAEKQTFKGVYFKIEKDLSFADMPVQRQPIRTSHKDAASGTNAAPMSYVILDGNGKTISNVKMEYEYENYSSVLSLGFFESIGTVKNLKFQNADMKVAMKNITSTSANRGPFIALIAPSVNCNRILSGPTQIPSECFAKNCNISVDVKNCLLKDQDLAATVKVMGLLGSYTVNNAGFEGNITVHTDDTSTVQLFGINDTIVDGSYYKGNVTLNGNGDIYGLAQRADNSYIEGNIIAAGNINNISCIAQNPTCCYAKGKLDLTARSDFSIGLVGGGSLSQFTGGMAEECYSAMDVSVHADRQVHGVVESVRNYAEKCFFAGHIDVSRTGEGVIPEEKTIEVYYCSSSKSYLSNTKDFYFLSDALSANLENSEYCTEHNIKIDKQSQYAESLQLSQCCNSDFVRDRLGWDLENDWEIPVGSDFPILRGVTNY